MNSDTEPTLDERIEALQKKIQLQRQSDHEFYGKSFIREDEVTAALAIIDELRNDKLAESREDMAHAEVERLKAENAELKAKYEEMDKFADLMWEEHECENNPCPTCAQYDVLVLGGVR